MKPIHQKEGEFSPSSSKSTSHAVLKSPLFYSNKSPPSDLHNSKGAVYFQRTRPKPIKELMEEYEND